LREDLAIVIVAYNRPNSLFRLLGSLNKLKYENKDLTLIISIDYSDNNEVKKIANNYEWDFGVKRVVSSPQRLGLKKHVLQCGDITEEFENIIVLEDDLIVSPFMVSYSDQAIAFYKNSDNIAGISLYSHRKNIINHLPFFAYEDGYDNFFLQVAQSWGQIWSRDRWRNFKNWLINKNPDVCIKSIHPYYLSWPDSSWLKLHMQYIVANNLYFVYPRVSLTTNCGDVGTNVNSADYSFMVPIMMGNKDYHFSSFLETSSIHDSFFEMTSSNVKKILSDLDDITFEVDTYGEKLAKNKIFGLSFNEDLDRKNSFVAIYNQPAPLQIGSSNESTFGVGIISKNRNNSKNNYQIMLKMNYGRLSVRDLCFLLFLKIRKKVNRK
jgi:hypothetical protein